MDYIPNLKAVTMNNKTRLILLIALYFLKCIFDYMFTNSFNWSWNVVETVVAFAFIILFIEFDLIEKMKK